MSPGPHPDLLGWSLDVLLLACEQSFFTTGLVTAPLQPGVLELAARSSGVVFGPLSLSDFRLDTLCCAFLGVYKGQHNNQDVTDICHLEKILGGRGGYICHKIAKRTFFMGIKITGA